MKQKSLNGTPEGDGVAAGRFGHGNVCMLVVRREVCMKFKLITILIKLSCL